MNVKSTVAISLVTLLSVSACVDPNAYPGDPNARGRTGAVAGGLLGAFTGLASGDDNQLMRALVGGAIGAAAGGAIGASLDAQAADLRAAIKNQRVSIINHGSFLTVSVPDDLLFAVNSAELRPTLTNDLFSVADVLQRYPDSLIDVIGHTDNTGTAEYNQRLSERRALSVSDVLLNGGLSPRRVRAFGRGEDQPAASNLTAQGRALNRRVEIIVRPNA